MTGFLPSIDLEKKTLEMKLFGLDGPWSFVMNGDYITKITTLNLNKIDDYRLKATTVFISKSE